MEKGGERTDEVGDSYTKVPIEGRRYSMRSKLILDGNAFYEIDEECMERKRQEEKEEGEKEESRK